MCDNLGVFSSSISLPNGILFVSQYNHWNQRAVENYFFDDTVRKNQKDFIPTIWDY